MTTDVVHFVQVLTLSTHIIYNGSCKQKIHGRYHGEHGRRYRGVQGARAPHFSKVRVKRKLLKIQK